jgi:Cft2 family RNA processing exonuclease
MFLALGGGDEIGASCYLYQLGPTRLLVDAGMRLRRGHAFPDFNRLDTEVGGAMMLDAFLLTHAHLDHCGALARVQYEAPNVPKVATPATVELVQVILGDAHSVKRSRAEDWQLSAIHAGLLDAALDSFQTREFGVPFVPNSARCQVTPYRAGHIAGAASYLIETDSKRVLHTGDISVHSQRAVPGMDTNWISGEIDVLVIEATYAYQPVYQDETSEEQQASLVDAVSRIVEQGGHVIIPAFAVGRAQEIACLLGDFFGQQLVEPFPVILDGLVKPVCDVYHRHRALLSGRHRTQYGHAIYDQWIQPSPNHSYPDHVTIDNMDPCCVIASSGMLLDGTRSAVYAATWLQKPENALFFSGFLDDESPGRFLLTMATASKAVVNGHPITIQGAVERYHLTAHAPSADLRTLIDRLQPKQLVLIHGSNRHNADAGFLRYLMTLEAQGVQVHHAANGVPIFL